MYDPLSQSDECVPDEIWPGKPCLADHKKYLYFRPTSVRGRTPHSFSSQLKFVNSEA